MFESKVKHFILMYIFLENDPCDPNPCNQGDCHLDDNSGNITCVCNEGYKGLRCDDNL